MPTVAVDKADLWERLGQEYCISIPFFLTRICLDRHLPSFRGL